MAGNEPTLLLGRLGSVLQMVSSSDSAEVQECCRACSAVTLSAGDGINKLAMNSTAKMRRSWDVWEGM